jgi:osmotically-inducible protein OsmY
MQTNFRKLALSAAIAAGVSLTALSAAGAAQAAPVSQEVTDARQEAMISTTYALSPYLRANDIDVSVSNGRVVLTGIVQEDVNKDLAKQLAMNVEGITSVDNQLEIAADDNTPARPSNRRYGERVDDATTSAAIRSKLNWSQRSAGTVTEVDTNWGRVVLKGTAANAEEKALAGRLAMNTRGVTSVDNQLVVGNGKSKAKADGSGTETVSQDIADSWITAKVKSTFMYSTNVDSGDIEVSTEGGNVTLSGKVHSGAERALAIELAKNVRGVKTVSTKALVL